MSPAIDKHRRLSKLSAKLYLGYLKTCTDTTNEPGNARVALIRTISDALKGIDSSAFNSKQLLALSIDDRTKLVNPYSIGLGNPDAKILIVGTEHAYDPTDPLCLSLEGCALTYSWLLDLCPESTARIANEPSWGGRSKQFHRNPADYYRSVHHNHTWARAAEVLETTVPHLFELSYQIELSSHPAKNTSQGRFPSRSRIRFLTKFLQSMQESINVVMFHGKQNVKGFEKVRNILVDKYLGEDVTRQVIRPNEYSHSGNTATQSIDILTSSRFPRRVVIVCRALGGASGSTRKYREALSRIVQNYLKYFPALS